ncbi:MAG: LD-carboxypeptidase [Polyangiales bacterium]
MAPPRAQVLRGDLVAIVSPSGPSPAEHIRAGAARISARYRVAIDERAFATRGYLAGSDDDRAQSLLDALRDRAVRAIWCTRGGYGATRVLEQYGHEITEALRADPKPIIGFSDITALHCLWSSAGARSIHGPMVARIGADEAISDDALAAVFDAIEGRTRPMRAERFWFRRGFEGVAVGGNLAVLAALVGTSHAPQFNEEHVVFLEDVGERPYRVDRMLTQLRASAKILNVAGFVLGEFKDCGEGPDGTSIEHVLLEGLRSIGAPVVVGAPFGHGERCAAFELGARVRVEDDCRIEWPCAT